MAARNSAALPYQGIGSSHAMVAAATTIHIRIRESIFPLFDAAIRIYNSSTNLGQRLSRAAGATLGALCAFVGAIPDTASIRRPSRFDLITVPDEGFLDQSKVQRIGC
jgi:hypothetical protein